MDETKLHTKNDEQEISLGGIFNFLLKRWKSIILISLIGLIIGVLHSTISYKKLLAQDRTYININKIDLTKVELLHTYNNILKELQNDIASTNTADFDTIVASDKLLTNIKNLNKDLNWDEKAYYSQYYMNKTLERPAPVVSYKYPLLYFVLAAFIMCFIYAMRYIFNHQVKTATELNDTFGLHVIGVYKGSPNKKGIAGLLDKKESKNDLVSNTEEYIINAVSELNKSPIVVLCNSEKEIVKSNVKNITSKIPNVTNLGFLQNDPKAIAEAHKSNGAIIVVSLWDSTIDEINREIEIALVQNINILGCIVIK